MISENYVPWLLEMNSSPGMAPTSLEKTKLCAAVMRDTFKGPLIDELVTDPHCLPSLTA